MYSHSRHVAAIETIIEVALQEDLCLLFNYFAEAPASGEYQQMPLVKPLDIEETKNGLLLKGLNLRRVKHPSLDLRDAVRSYRLDRMSNCMII